MIAEGEIEDAVERIGLEGRFGEVFVAVPDLAQKEEILAQPQAGKDAVRRPEIRFDMLVGIKAEAVDPGALGKADMSVEDRGADVKPLGLEVGQAREAHGDRVATALGPLTEPVWVGDGP